jgi:hypothetical protein
MTTHSHHDHVDKQFGSQAKDYLTSAVDWPLYFHTPFIT